MSRAAETPRWVRAILGVPLIWAAARMALVSAFLIGGLTKLSDFSAAISEQEHFGLHPGWLWAALAIIIELGGSALVMLGWQVWLGAGGLGVLTAVAMLTANDFWHLTGHDRFMALNAFFEHLGLIAGLVIVSIHAAGSERK
ncbi:DoxX family protein [Bradyrhizobium sp. th.b2]|uniref:DoxX family protein n=1 Tax=Bradyrhizobium sp. th-b2 TaxID=172088 RepID=UPI0004154C5F|nr:DoxX family protein [Bradyrhizobium sp. th.b2]